MNMELNHFDTIIPKLEVFIRRYYTNQILRGLIFFLAIALISFLVIDVAEHIFRFGKTGRGILFFGGLAVAIGSFIGYVILPIVKLMKLGKRLSYHQASEIIGAHFPEVSDKLLNTLQLSHRLSEEYSELLLASIEQKSLELKPVPFQFAIDFKVNTKYVKYLAIPLVTGGIILLISPGILTESSQRIVSYETEFIPPSPFQFTILNTSFSVAKNQDYMLEVSMQGEEVPSAVYVLVNGQQQPMVKQGPRNYRYRFKHLQESFSFQLQGDRYFSGSTLIEVVPNPTLKKFAIAVDYPDYLGLENEEILNQGDLQVPEGSRISWKLEAEDADRIDFSFSDTLIRAQKLTELSYEINYQAFISSPYSMHITNNYALGNDSMTFALDVRKDEYPKVSIETERDSNSYRMYFFSGQIEDDYGFTALGFYYRKMGAKQWTHRNIRIAPGINRTRFGYIWEPADTIFDPGSTLEYYFRVTDNDGLRGGKSTQTPLYKTTLPSLDSLRTLGRENNKTFKEEMEKSIKEAKRLRESFQELRKEWLQKKNLDWQDKKQMESLLDDQKRLENKLNNLNQERNLSQQQQNEVNPINENLLEKQEELNRLFDEIMTDEMKQLYDEIQKLMDELNKDMLQEQMQNFEMSNEDLEKELNRALELFKKLEVEQQLNETIETLKNLAKKQEELAKETMKPKSDKDKLADEQNDLEEAFEEMEEKLEETLQNNQNLENPMQIDSQQDERSKIKEQMEESQENLDQNKKKKAAQNQQDAAQKMEEMAQKMEGQMQQGQQQALMEDMNALRKLLDNIIDLSHNQEDVMGRVSVTGSSDPIFIELSQEQRTYIADAQHIGDSLYALSKRVAAIESYVNKEMSEVNRTMNKALEKMAERNGQMAMKDQQYAMTSLNNLALLLDDALAQMQQQMANSMPGQGNCQKPGQGQSEPSVSDLQKMQDQMAKQLDQLKKQLEKGDKPGGEQKGGQSTGMSKEIAQMAAQQAAIRESLEKLANQLNEQGKGEGNELKEITKMMEENEQDLARITISRQTMLRQQEITSRLLKAEKAEREREWDEERKSDTPKSYEISNPDAYSKYKKIKKKEAEMLETLPPDLNPYYKRKVSTYFNKLETD
jgi:hypothetical protein